MDDKLKEDIEAVVAEIFSQNEEAEKIDKTEKALNKSAEVVSKLTTSLEEKNTKEEEMSSELTDLKESVTNLTTELEAAQEEVKQSNEKLAEAENKVEGMKKDKAAEVRMDELLSAGVALSDKESQTVKVREMDDEMFASYKDELISLRKSVETELKTVIEDVNTPEAKAKAKAEAEAKTKAEAEAKAKTDADEVDTDENDNDGTPPANVDPNVAVAAAMNLEIQPSDTVISKYQKLGKAMADTMKNS